MHRTGIFDEQCKHRGFEFPQYSRCAFLSCPFSLSLFSFPLSNSVSSLLYFCQPTFKQRSRLIWTADLTGLQHSATFRLAHASSNCWLPLFSLQLACTLWVPARLFSTRKRPHSNRAFTKLLCNPPDSLWLWSALLLLINRKLLWRKSNLLLSSSSDLSPTRQRPHPHRSSLSSLLLMTSRKLFRPQHLRWTSGKLERRPQRNRLMEMSWRKYPTAPVATV